MRRLSPLAWTSARTRPFLLLPALLACAPSVANAEPSRTAVAPAAHPWELGPLVGYAHAWTTGLSHFEAGVGLSLDYELRCHWTFGGALIHHFGAFESATGPRSTYAARAQSDSSTLHAGYTFRIANRLLLRPALAVEGTLVSGFSEVGGVRRSNLTFLGAIGPSMAVMVRFGSQLFGIQGDAWLVPSDVAAPVGAIYGVFRIRL